MQKLAKTYYHSRIYRVVTATFQPLLPLVFIGTWAQALLLSAFVPEGFFAQVFELAKWWPAYQICHEGLALLSTYTIGLLGILSAIFAARAEAQTTDSRPTLVAGIGFLMLNTNRLGTFGPNVGVSGIFWGLLFGVIVGMQFKNTASWWRAGAILIATASLRLSLNHFTTSSLYFSLPRGGSHKILLMLINSVAAWIGLPAPIDPLAPMLTGTAATANLNTALAHHALPHLLTIGTLYRPYAMFGGVGATLGLVIALLIVAKQHRRLAWWSLPLGLLNYNLPLMIGLPILFNPVMLVPFIAAPLTTSAIAWVALHFHLIAASVYQVPATTPGLMIAWLTTDGNWPALIVTGLCLVVSILIYLPFVRLMLRGEDHA